MATLNEIAKWLLAKLGQGEIKQKELVAITVREFKIGYTHVEQLIATLAFTGDKVRLDIREGFVWVSLGAMNDIEADTFLLRVITEKPII